MKRIKELKKGEYFTLKDVEYPSENIVWVRGDYERSMKKYSCYKFSDVCHERFFKGDKEVYTEFTF